jgi:hypothetical protein
LTAPPTWDRFLKAQTFRLAPKNHFSRSAPQVLLLKARSKTEKASLIPFRIKLACSPEGID